MRVKLTQPLPQIGRVIPAGVILSDAPEALMEKLIRQGRAALADEEEAAESAAPFPTQAHESAPEPERKTKKRRVEP